MMNDKELYYKYIELEDVHEKLERYRRDFIKTVRGNPEFYDTATKFSKRIEEVLAWYQLEMNSLAFALIKEIESAKKLIRVMEAYGIDPSEALSRNGKDSVECGFKIPEKLSGYIDWDKVNKDYMKNKADELIKEFPHLKSKIYEAYLK